MINMLKTELDFFELHREEWFEHYANKVVVIHGTTIHGFYDTYETALRVGYDKCGIVPFLIKEVQLVDEVIFIPTIFSTKDTNEH